MTTTVDTNVLLDILIRDENHWQSSYQRLLEEANRHAVIVSEPVYSELAARFAGPPALDSFLRSSGAEREPSSAAALHLAGQAWSQYLANRRPAFDCPECGASVRVSCGKCGAVVTRRQHVLADFMIGAHAQVQAGRLLTRDRGFYGKYFPELELV